MPYRLKFGYNWYATDVSELRSQVSKMILRSRKAQQAKNNAKDTQNVPAD